MRLFIFVYLFTKSALPLLSQWSRVNTPNFSDRPNMPPPSFTASRISLSKPPSSSFTAAYSPSRFSKRCAPSSSTSTAQYLSPIFSLTPSSASPPDTSGSSSSRMVRQANVSPSTPSGSPSPASMSSLILLPSFCLFPSSATCKRRRVNGSSLHAFSRSHQCASRPALSPNRCRHSNHSNYRPCIASIIRIIALRNVTLENLGELIWEHDLWCGIEMTLATTCACLPTLTPFIARHFPGLLEGAGLSLTVRRRYRHAGIARLVDENPDANVRTIGGGIGYSRGVSADASKPATSRSSKSKKTGIFRAADADVGDVVELREQSPARPQSARHHWWWGANSLFDSSSRDSTSLLSPVRDWGAGAGGGGGGAGRGLGRGSAIILRDLPAAADAEISDGGKNLRLGSSPEHSRNRRVSQVADDDEAEGQRWSKLLEAEGKRWSMMVETGVYPGESPAQDGEIVVLRPQSDITALPSFRAARTGRQGQGRRSWWPR
ncbi:hypothetical protein MPH_09322 [Macrophomina phaseolina MS6]|uniref:Uncharacterized protein n=1 Tax=Macrophomina phaseolina (strain MS6) TaxID=1126212 RepID=K2RG51_MACPH|nr:hypothetical protein MPH_09322 [Macrophomina phaseolina MS6]